MDKQEFIQQELKIHGEYLQDLFIAHIIKYGLTDTANLKRTIQGDVYTVSPNKLSFSFPNYGRFIEINWHKSIKATLDRLNGIKKQKTIITKQDEVKGAIWGYKVGKRKKRKNTNWYTRNVFRGQDRLVDRIMFGYKEEIRNEFKTLDVKL